MAPSSFAHSLRRSYPANNHDHSSNSENNHDNSQQSPWQPHVQVGRDVNALALPQFVEAPFDTRPPLYPPSPRSQNQNQRQQHASSSYYGSSSPLRDFVPPQELSLQPYSRLGVLARSLSVAQATSRIGAETLAGELAAEAGRVSRTQAAPLEEYDFSDLVEFDLGTLGLDSEEGDVGVIADPYRNSTTARSFDLTSHPSTMNPPPRRASPSSSQLPSQHRTRRRSSTATLPSRSNQTTIPSQSSSKRRRTSITPTGAHNRTSQPTPTFSTAKSIEQIDLSLDSDPDDIALSSTLGKQRFDAIASQSASSAIKPTTSPNSRGHTKLNTLQCTVCLDTPKDLTATSCGHTFCHSCLMDWLVAAERDGGGQGRRSNCPACRKPISRVKKGDIIPLEIKVTRRARRK